MLTERQPFRGHGETGVAVVEAPAARRDSDGRRAARVAQFLAVLLQFGLVVLIVDYWQLESQSLARLLWLAFAGFTIHHLLPQRFRLSFFVILWR